MTDVLLDNVLERPRFTWGSGDLSRVQHGYTSALHAADEGNHEPLREFVRT